MKIVHFILGKANPERANGVNMVVYAMAKNQSLCGHEVTVVGISKSMMRSYEIVDRGNFFVHAFKRFWGKGFDFLKDIIRECDIVHMHGVWNTYNVIVGRFCEKEGKPYVITVHGGYAEDRLRQSNYWLKRLYHYCFQKHLYERASGLHALTEEESTCILTYCRNKNVFVLPNGMDECFSIHEVNVDKDRFTLGYLGRFSIEKNTLSLVEAMSLLPIDILSKIELKLIGPENKYSAFLKKKIKILGLENNIFFVGAKYGKEKEQELLNLDLYVHPAFSEGFSMSILEVLAYGIPSILTRTSNVCYFYDRQSFYMSEPTALALSKTIVRALLDKNSWKERSELSIALVNKELNWKIIIDKLLYEYNLILQKY